MAVNEIRDPDRVVPEVYGYDVVLAESQDLALDSAGPSSLKPSFHRVILSRRVVVLSSSDHRPEQIRLSIGGPLRLELSLSDAVTATGSFVPRATARGT
jgi:hypothetical protein